MIETSAPLLDPAVQHVIALSRLTAFVLTVPSGEVRVASSNALAMLGAESSEVIGRRLADFVEGDCPLDLDSVLSGDVTGYETHRVVSASGERHRFWVRAISDDDPVSFALVVVLDELVAGNEPWRLARSDANLRVFGAVNGRMVIDRVTVDIEHSLGHRAEDIAGTSLFLLVDQDDVAGVLLAMARLVGSHEAISMRVRAVCADRSRLLCRLVLIPMAPAPSFTFALLPILGVNAAEGEVAVGTLSRLAADAEGAGISEVPPPTPISVPVEVEPRLTPREDELVARLLAGDRVPVIAEALYLSQGTVRNQLSTLYAKLGVNSQQQLIALLRS